MVREEEKKIEEELSGSETNKALYEICEGFEKELEQLCEAPQESKRGDELLSFEGLENKYRSQGELDVRVNTTLP